MRVGWVLLLALGVLGVERASGQVLAVDDGEGAPGYTETGVWTTTSNAGAGFNGSLYRFTNRNNPASTAMWRPVFPADGAYEVFAVFRRGGDRTSNAPYTIVHRDGVASRSLDQTGVFAGDLAVESLGAYRFSAGSDGSVTLSNTGGTGVYIADAVLFVPDAPPVISGVGRAPLYPGAGEDVRITARVEDSSAVASVFVEFSVDGGAPFQVPAVDDGMLGDVVAGDGVYTGVILGQADGAEVSFSIVATDSLGSVSSEGPFVYTVGESGSWQLVINEVVASNSSVASDPDFDASGDWVELLNLGPDAADLTGLALSDNPGNPGRWVFPSGTVLAAGEYLVVWCDGRDFVGQALHTNFSLSASGESVVLYDTVAEQVLDSVDWASMATDEALARIPNGTGDFETTIEPTPGAENVAGMRGPTPVFSVDSGLFEAPIQVSISADGAAEIRYTLDGSIPTASSSVYTDPLAISTTTGLRARAFFAAMEPSRIASASYFFNNEADRRIPVINIVADPADLFDPVTGIYPNFNERGTAWEKPVHVSIFSPDGSVSESLDAGIRIHGGFSRSAAKRSFRLYFRNQYGASSASLPWMERSPVGEIQQLVLRAGGNDGFLVTSLAQLQEVTFIRDQLMRDWYHQQGHYAADGFFAALYLNGQYWGLYNATERITDDQMGVVTGQGADQDVVKGTWTFETKYFTEATDGDLTAWNQFLAWLGANDAATDPGMEGLKQRIDYRNFLDFFALNIFCQNEDWPHNNWIASRHRTNPAARWIFHEWDTEWGLGLRPQGWQSDSMQWAMGSNFHLSPSHNGRIAPLSMLFNGNDLDASRPSNINGILDHPNGLRDFLVSLEDFMNFEAPPEKAIAEFDHYVDLIASEIPREAARWAPSTSRTPVQLQGFWAGGVANLRLFLQNRPAFMQNLMSTKFNLGGTRRITFESAGSGSGKLRVRGRLVELPWTGTFFNGSAIDVAAVPDSGSSFKGWSGLFSGEETARVYTTTAGGDGLVQLQFGSGGIVYRPNDVIFNEYWVNDNGTFYDSIGAAIDRDWLELLVVRSGTDLRGWRVTSNPTIATNDAVDSGSIIFPDLPALQSLRAGTIVLVVSSINDTNTASFPEDDLDPTDGRLIFYAGNGNLDITTDPGFGIGTADDVLVLLAPGGTGVFADDVGIDFIAEGTRVTPASFFGTDDPPVVFINPFEGIGGDDGAVFLNDPNGGFNNDNGADPDRTDFLPGPGGWIVDPPAAFTGDTTPVQENWLTPGAPNRGQDLTGLSFSDLWILH